MVREARFQAGAHTAFSDVMLPLQPRAYNEECAALAGVAGNGCEDTYGHNLYRHPGRN